MNYCGDRFNPPPYNLWLVCILEFGHIGPHKSAKGVTWDSTSVYAGSANAST